MRFSYRFNAESFDKQAIFLTKLLDKKLYFSLKEHFIVSNSLANQITYEILDKVFEIIDGVEPLEYCENEFFTPYLCFINTQNSQLLHAGGSQLSLYYTHQSETCCPKKPKFKSIKVFVDEAENYWEKIDFDMKSSLVSKVLEIVDDAIKFHALEFKIKYSRANYDVAGSIFGVLDGYNHSYHVKPFIIYKPNNQTWFLAESDEKTDFIGLVMFYKAY